MGDVVRRVEPDMALVPCFEPVHASCPIVPACGLRGALYEARQAFLAVLDRYSLADLVQRRAELAALLHAAWPATGSGAGGPSGVWGGAPTFLKPPLLPTRWPPMAATATTPRDTSIRTYRARRDFTRTAEPQPKPGAAADTLRFVVQKHAARRLHWDFRLQHEDVLWSWAVPRGPSLDPHDKRLAVHVEDHPLEYADFEGIIPAGEYGAGTVEIWDHGTWAPVGDAVAGMAKGELKFTLDGVRLHGRFVLVRLRPRPREHGENWLLIKEHDENERAGADVTVLEAEPLAADAASKPGASKPGASKSGASKPARSSRRPDASAALHPVTLTHPDRELWPGITKRDLATYWHEVAPIALPGIAARPLALVRCPEGIGGERFFQKHAGRGMPAADPPRCGGGGAVSRDRRRERPDRLRAGRRDRAAHLGCDRGRPGTAGSDRVRPRPRPGRALPRSGGGGARGARPAGGAGAASFCRTSGGKGLHVVVPLRPRATGTW